MKAKWCVGLLAFGFVAMFVGVAAAVTLPNPVIYLKMDGNLTNSGTGGSAYNGAIDRSGTLNDWGDPVYNTAKDGQGICLNPNLVPTGDDIMADGVPFKDVGGRNIAIPYVPANSGTIAMWYNVTSPMYQYISWFNDEVDMANPRSSDAWEGWINEYGGVGARVYGWDSNMVSDLPPAEAIGWHHLAFTWNRHDGTKVDTALYLDGIVTGSVLTNLDWGDPGPTFYIGGNHHNSVANGTFDEVRIYEERLTDEQIAAVKRIPMAGDANIDWTVNVADLTNLLNNYNKTGMAWENGDFNFDGIVNVADLTALLNNYNKTVPAVFAAGTAVPEPSSIVLLATLSAMLGAWVIRRRNR
jgi:hypothetical protein